MVFRYLGEFGVVAQGAVIFALFFALPGALGSEAAAAAGERQLSLSLPEIVVESPDIERIVAQRVRPLPPFQLGVRIPRIFPQIEMPRINPLPRPFPPEREPDPGLTDVAGRFSRFFGDDDKIFESGLAYLKKNSPVEALSFFMQSMKSADSPRLKAAARFWAAESLVRLGRDEEARQMRAALTEAGAEAAGPYRYAARYALAARGCRDGELDACLKWVEGESWKAGDFAYEEARFLKAWAHTRKGEQGKALDILTKLASIGGASFLQAQVSMGHLYFASGEYEKARNIYLNIESARAPQKKDFGLMGEALNGLGWSRLLLGKTAEAGSAFSHFLKRHPNHPQVFSAGMGRLAVRIEKDGGKVLRELNDFIKKNPASEHIGPLRLQMAWALFNKRKFKLAQRLAASVSDKHALGRIYRLGRIIEGLSLYHLDKIRAAYGVLRTGAESPPIGGSGYLAERGVARSAAMATAFAAFRLKDYAGAQTVLRHWAFQPSPISGGGADSEAALWYGEAAFEAGDLKQARRAFERITKNAEEWYRAQAGLAWIHYRKLEWKQAAVLFDRVFAAKPLGPLAAEALARAGEARFNLGDYAGALKAFELVEKEFAGGAVAGEALLEKGKLLFRRNRLTEAGEAFEQYLKKYPKSDSIPTVKFWSALVMFRKGRYRTARELLLTFVERYPKSALAPMAYLRVGDAFYNEGRYLQANRAYRLMLNRYRDHPRGREAAYGLSLTYLQQGEISKFLSGAKEFIETYGGDELSIALAFQSGEILLARGDLNGALRSYREVGARFESSGLVPHALLRIANIHRRRKELDAALDAYETLISRYPKSILASDALFGVGESLAAVGRCPEARIKLAIFLERYPKHDYRQIALFESGRCAVREGDSGAAIINFKRVIEEHSGAPSGIQTTASLLLSKLLSKQGRLREAAEALKGALESGDPKIEAEAFFARADLLLQANDRRAAPEFLKLTYRYPEQTIWVVKALARAGGIYEKSGRRVTALRIFKKMSRVAPTGPFKKMAFEAVSRLSNKNNSRP